MYFPIFISAEGQTALVVGGGTIAVRRATVLHQFGFNIIIVAPDISPTLRELSQSGRITLIERAFKPGDMACNIAVAATNDREVNRLVGELARDQGIPVSVADNKAECTFFFPSTIIDTNNIVIGVGGDGSDHAAVKSTAERIRRALNG